MIQIFARYLNDGRELKQLITILLKKQLILSADILNYGKHYSLIENKVQKIEQKYVIFSLLAEKKDDFSKSLEKLDLKKNLIIIDIKIIIS